MSGKRDSLESRFWAKVIKTDHCWKWIATTNGVGYGMIQRGFMPHRKILAHRVSWAIHNGAIPDGMLVLHHCDNPECTNPKHLFLGTFTDNMRDKEQKGRHGRTPEWHAKRKELGKRWKSDPIWKANNAAAAAKRRKLSPEQEKHVVRLRKNGESIHALSRIFEIDRSSIKRILQY